jgi:WD40 repeat protein
VITAGFDKMARIHDAANGAELALLSGHEDDVLSAAYSSSGWIVTTSRDRSVRLWSAFGTTQALIDYARALVPRDLTPEQREQYFLSASPVSSSVGVGTATKGQ